MSISSRRSCLRGACWTNSRKGPADRKSTRLNSSHSLSDALPIWLTSLTTPLDTWMSVFHVNFLAPILLARGLLDELKEGAGRSEEHTSELQSLPIRRSSDLANIADDAARYLDERLPCQFPRADPACAGPVGRTQGRGRQIGRAHV